MSKVLRVNSLVRTAVRTLLVVTTWLCLGVSSVEGGIVLVQSRSTAANSSTSISTTYLSTPTAGNLLVAIAANRVGQGAPTTPAGWSVAISATNTTPGQVIFYKIASGLEGTVTVSGYSVSEKLLLHIYEYSGIVATNPLDQVNSNSGSGGNPNSGNITTTRSNELLVSGIVWNRQSGISPWGNSFTSREETSIGAGSSQVVAGGADQTVPNTGTYVATACCTDSYAWSGAIASFVGVKTWDGGAGTNNWGDANNWEPNGVPASTDVIELTGANTININVAAVCNNITLNNSGLTLNVNSGQSLTASGDLTLSAGTLRTANAFPSVTGTVNVATGTVEYNAASGSQTVSGQTYNTLIISGGGTKTLDGNCSMGGNLTISGGTLDLSTFTANRGSAGGTLTVSNGTTLNMGGTNGIPSNYSTHSIGATSTIEYSGTNQTVSVLNSSQNYGHLKLSGSGTKTAAAGLTVNGNFTINSGPTFSAGSYSHVVKGNFSNSGTFTASTSTVTLNGTSAQAIGGSSTTAFNNLALSNTSATISANTNFSAGGTVTVNASVILSPAAAVVVSGAGTLTGSGKVMVTRTAATPDFSSQYTITNKTLTNLTVEYSATAAQTISAVNYSALIISGSRTTNNVTFASSGTVGISGALTLSATFTSGGYVTTGSTVNFNGSGSQTIPAISYNNLTSSSTGARTLAGSGTIGVAGTFTPGTNSYTITGSTVNFNGAGAQSVAAFNYNNLTLSTSGTKTFGSGTTGVAGTFTIGGTASADATTNSSAIDYNGSGAQTIAAINYFDLSLSNGGTKTFASGSTGIAGTFTINAGPMADATTNSPTVDYNGSGAQTVTRINYHNLTLSNAGTKTLASGTTRIAGALTISGSATADATANSTTVEYNGAGAQTVPALSYFNVTLNTSGTKTFAAGTTSVANSLTLSGSATADATTNSTTISYNGSGAQTVAAINYNNLTLTTAGVKSFASGTSGIAGTFTIGGTASANTTTNSATVNYNGGGAQTVLALNYYTLTLSNAGVKTLAAGTTGIANTVTVSGSASCNATSNSATVDYNGVVQTVAALNYHNLTLSNAGAKTFAVGTSGIAGTLTISGTASANATANSSTISFNGSGAQNVNAITYHHLTISGGNTKTASGALTVNGDLTIGSSTTLSAGSYTHTIQGNFSNSGTFTAGTSTVQLTGSNDVSIPGATTFNILTINKNASTNTVTLNNNVSTATLTMTQGKISTGANSILVTSSRTGNGLVIGTITRTHTFNTSTAYAFEGPYQTLTFNSGGTLPTSVTVTTTLSSPGANDYMDPISRYYVISQTGGAGFSYALRLHYEEGEVTSPNSETSPPLKTWRRTATGPDVWTREGATSNSTTDNWVEQAGLTNVGTFSLSSRTVANMVLTLSQSATNPSPGDQVTYTLIYTNNGDGSSTNTLVTAAAPTYTSYVASSTQINGVGKTDASDADEVTVSGSTISINLGTVAASGSGTITYRVVVN